MTTFIYVGLFVAGLIVLISIFVKPSEQSKKEQPHKPTDEEFDKVMKMLMIHGVISNSEYTKMYNSGRAFTKKS